jgi:GNAT superfamily N-acetyltransferase
LALSGKPSTGLDVDDDFVRVLVELDAARTEAVARNRAKEQRDAFTVRRFGGAFAMLDPTRPREGFYNRVVGFGPADMPVFDDVVAHYERSSVPCQIDLTPNVASAELIGAFEARGFRHRGAICWFRARPARRPAGPIVVRHATGDDLAIALEVHREARGDPPYDDEELRWRLHHFATHPSFRVFLARLDGEPAAVTTAFRRGDMLLLSNARTLPDKQRRGCQRALLEHLLGVAADEGLRGVAADTFFGTTSHRNVERAGFRMAFMTGWWVRDRV